MFSVVLTPLSFPHLVIFSYYGDVVAFEWFMGFIHRMCFISVGCLLPHSLITEFTKQGELYEMGGRLGKPEVSVKTE